MRRRLVPLLSLLFVALPHFEAAAQHPPYPPPPPPSYGYAYGPGPGYHAHDGFLLRFAIGFGGINQTAMARGSGEVSATGAGVVGVYDFAIGGVIARNTALHLTGFGFAVPKETDVALPNGGSILRLKAVAAAGVGLTHYTPSNLYVTGAIGVGSLIVSVFNGPEETLAQGFAMQVGVGKEWWVSANWGLGLQGLIGFARAAHDVGVWNTLWGGVAFSATYN